MSVLHIGIISALLATARGGSERVAANVANAMVSRGHRVTVFTFSSSQGCSVYPLDSNVTLRFMDASDQQEAVQANRHMFALTGLDVCVAMQGYWEQLLFILEFLGTGIPYILSEHSCPANIERYWTYASARVSGLAAGFFACSSMLHSQSCSGCFSFSGITRWLAGQKENFAFRRQKFPH